MKNLIFLYFLTFTISSFSQESLIVGEKDYSAHNLFNRALKNKHVLKEHFQPWVTSVKVLPDSTNIIMEGLRDLEQSLWGASKEFDVKVIITLEKDNSMERYLEGCLIRMSKTKYVLTCPRLFEKGIKRYTKDEKFYIYIDRDTINDNENTISDNSQRNISDELSSDNISSPTTSNSASEQ